MIATNIALGIQLLAQYCPGGPDAFYVQAEHDQIYAGDEDVPPAVDAMLRQLGWAREDDVHQDQEDSDSPLVESAGLWYAFT